jgi:hypothetical protein
MGSREWLRPGQHGLELRYLYAMGHDPTPQHPPGERCVTAAR